MLFRSIAEAGEKLDRTDRNAVACVRKELKTRDKNNQNSQARGFERDAVTRKQEEGYNGKQQDSNSVSIWCYLVQRILANSGFIASSRNATLSIMFGATVLDTRNAPNDLNLTALSQVCCPRKFLSRQTVYQFIPRPQ